MKNRHLVAVISLVLVLGMALYADAQTTPAAPATTATPATPPTAPAPTITALTPATINSDAAREIKREMTLRGTTLDAIKEIKLVDGVEELVVTVIDNASATQNQLSVAIPANTAGVYTLNVNGTALDKFKVTVKDAATIKAELVARQAAQGAAAAAQVKKLQAQVDAMQKTVDGLNAQQKTLDAQHKTLASTASDTAKLATAGFSTMQSDVAALRRTVEENKKAQDQAREEDRNNIKVLAGDVATIASTPVIKGRGFLGMGGKKEPVAQEIATRYQKASATASAQMLASNER